MKGKNDIVIYLLTSLVIFSSCEKKLNEISENKNPSEKINQLKSATIASTSSWSVNPEDLIDEIESAMELGSRVSQAELIRTKINVIFDAQSEKYTITHILFDDPFDPPLNGDRVCRGSGYSFATCCKNWLDANPKVCLTICSDGSGGYTADDQGC